jgi:hypothetical protein
MVKYKATTLEKKQHLWNNMHTRCYNSNYHKARPGYAECTICDQWLDEETGKQAFYDFVDGHYYTLESGECVDLDKDILIKGNKVYSPETCIFAPQSINVMFEHSIGKEGRELPIGVTYIDKTKNHYKASISIEGRTVALGYYSTPEEAFSIYKKHKEAAILAKADLYHDEIPEELYQAMIRWNVDPTD